MLFPSVLPTSISLYSPIYPTTTNEQTRGTLEKKNMEQHRRLQTHRELNVHLSINEGCAYFSRCSYCSKSCVNGSITTYKFWESSAMQKQLLNYVKVMGLNKETLQLHTFFGTKGKTMEGNVELTGKQFLSYSR